MQTLIGKGAKILLAIEETCRKRYNSLMHSGLQYNVIIVHKLIYINISIRMLGSFENYGTIMPN